MHSIENERAYVAVDGSGGAIIDFRLQGSAINPLSFSFTEDQMPQSNKGGPPFRGHFLCLGRWGPPSEGEKKAGMPDHGHFAKIEWTCNGLDKNIKMNAESDLEGLKVQRTIQIDEHLPLYLVTEKVTNINPLGRLYNMVQHPTLAAPFLTQATCIQCNASKGFHYQHYLQPDKYESNWPEGLELNGTVTDLRFCERGRSSVFSFVVADNARFGWITATSPDSNLLIGYLWKREHYPWINIWKDWDKDTIRYCGLEFGTTGIHQPFIEILKLKKSAVFNEEIFRYIDAGEEIVKAYVSFLVECPIDFGEVEAVYVKNRSLFIRPCRSGDAIELNSPLIESLR